MKVVWSSSVRPVSRRQLLASGLALTGLLVAACSQSAPTPPTSAPAAPAAPTQPSAPTPTAAAASTAPTPTTAAAPTAQPTAQSTPAAAKGAPIVPLAAKGADWHKLLDQEFALFTKTHPGLTVAPIYVPGEQFDPKTDLLIAAGTPPALWDADASRGFKHYSQKGLIQPLDALIARDKEPPLDDFFPRDLEACRWKGELHALPNNRGPWPLFYNKTIFDKANVPYPPTDWQNPNWTWDKYFEVAKALTITEGNKTTQFGTGIHSDNGWPAGWSFGGWWFNHDWATTGWVTKFLAPEDPHVAQAYQFWSDLSNKYHFGPTPAEAKAAGNRMALFLSGHAGMYPLGNLSAIQTFQSITAFKWGMAARPHPTSGAGHLGTWVNYWTIFRNISNPDGTWELLKFMLTAEAEAFIPIAGGRLSGRKSHQDQWLNYWKDKYPGLTEKEMRVPIESSNIDYISPDNFTVNFTEIDDQALEPVIQKIFLGDVSAEAGIAQMKPKVEQVIADTLKSMGYSG